MSNKGFIKLNRGIFDNFLWNEAREFSKAEAWIDLIQLARFEASTEIINGKVIELQRGEIPASRRYLELRWNWGGTKVSNFLKILAQMKMINQRQTGGQTIISLVKYSIYNDTQTTDKPQSEPQTNQTQTSDKPEANQYKEYKEYKEREESNNAHELSSLSVYESSESVNHSTPKMATYAQQDSKPAYTPPEVVNLSKEKPFDENDWTRLLDIFNDHTGKKLGTVAPMTRERFRALHRDGYTKSEIRKAIIEACKDPWHKERGYKVLTLDFFTKPENIERYQPSEKKPVKANFDWSSIPS